MRLLIIFFLLFSSCKFFDKKKLDPEAIFQEEIRVIDWKSLDQYPSFDICSETLNFNENKQCFEEVITNHIFDFFKKNQNLITTSSSDTLILNMLVSNSGVISISKINSNQFLQSEKDKIITNLTQSFTNLSTLYPAVKRGQHVQVSFQFPIILNTTK